MFYSIPYSNSLSKQVTIQCKTSEGAIEEYNVYIDGVANLLYGYSQALGVQPREQLYVRDDLCYSYVDEENNILYLHFWDIGSEALSGVGDIINSAACDNIIIDIRDNSGGYFNAINNYLYPFLYKDDIQADYTWYMPKTEYTKKMTSEWKACRELAFRKSDLTAIGANGEKQIYKESTKGVRLTGGKNVKDYPVMDLRKLIAIVPQSSHLFAGTVAENMRWGNPNATDEDIRAALDAAGALDFVLAKDGGIEARVEARGANFSGVQRQRLAIARALIRKPKILILDDSFSALDYATDLSVRTNIAKLEDSPATVIISQRPSAVMDADCIVVLDDGMAAGVGTHGELMDSCAVYRETYATQYGGDN